MTKKPSSPETELFSAGPTSLQAPAGKVEREAVDALRGYVYQVAVSALAWLDLRPNERLYLEVAEDYSICAQGALEAVQVKDTAQSATITLNSDNVKDALESFVNLVEANPSVRVKLRFLTTSEIGTEKLTGDRPSGMAGLEYWRAAAQAKDVDPLRTLLSRKAMPQKLRAFVAERSDARLRKELLQAIHWDCGRPDLASVLDELEQVVAKVGREKFGLASSSAKQATNAVLFAVLKKAVLKDRNRRFLTAADLDTVLDGASRVPLRQMDFDRLMQLASLAMPMPGTAGHIAPVARPPWIILDSELIKPSLLVPRNVLEVLTAGKLEQSGCIILAGATGLGKTLLARRIAESLSKPYAIIDFRELNAADTKSRLDSLVAGLHGLRVSCIIFDDLNHLEQPAVKAAFARLQASLKQRDQIGIVTCYRAPSNQLAAEIGVGAGCTFEVPYFTQEEVDELIRLAGGDPKIWGKVAMLAAGGGHPQLLMALVLGVASRGWSSDELNSVVSAGFASPDTDASRDEARRRLIAALPDANQTLLFRLSVKIGSFDRSLATALGAVAPQLAQSGKLLDGLAGSWVEILDGRRFRVSPLVHGAGTEVLDTDELRRVHSAIARHLVKGHKIDITDADALFAHGMAGEDDAILLTFARATIDSDPTGLEALSDYCVTFAGLQTTTTLYPKAPAVSAMIRLAQCRVLIAKGKIEKVDSSIAALLREIDDMEEPARASMEAVALLNLCMVQSIASRVTRWFDLLRRFRSVVEREKDLARLIRETPPPAGHEDLTLLGVFFLTGLSRLPSVARLEAIFDQLNGFAPADRDAFLADCERYPSDYDLIVSGAWLNEEQNGSLDWADAADRYLKMAKLAAAWGKTQLAAYCFKARAVMFDEYGKDGAAALVSLEEAKTLIGNDPTITREEIKIYWRAKDDQKVIDLFKPLEHEIAKDHGVERMFVMREAAISAFRLEDWAQSAKWFAEARSALEGNEQSKPTAIGLLADEAITHYRGGNFKAALELMAQALSRLSEIEGNTSLKSIYVQHIVRHACLWIKIFALKEDDMGLPFNANWEPGTGSNPQPLEVIREKPLGPIDITWYLLAEAEIALGVDAGIQSAIRERLKLGPITFLEGTLRKARLDGPIVSLRPAAFAKQFLPYLESTEYVRSFMSVPARERFNVMSPGRGELPKVTNAAIVGNPAAEAPGATAILSFAFVAALKREFGKLDELERDLETEFGSAFAGRNVFSRLRSEGEPYEALNEEIVRIIALMRESNYLEPKDVAGIGLRFSEFAYASHFKGELLPILLDWYRGEWTRILDTQRFLLKQPMHWVPEIEKALQFDGNVQQRLAALLLPTCEATGISLADSYKRELAERTKPPVDEDAEAFAAQQTGASAQSTKS